MDLSSIIAISAEVLSIKDLIRIDTVFLEHATGKIFRSQFAFGLLCTHISVASNKAHRFILFMNLSNTDRHKDS
jgi:hypothetical protein